MLHIRSRIPTHEVAREARHEAANVRRRRDRSAQITRGRPTLVLAGTIPPYLKDVYERIHAINGRFDVDTTGIIPTLNPRNGGYLYDLFKLLDETTCPPALYEGFRCFSILTAYSNNSQEIQSILPRERVDYLIYMIERIIHLSKDEAIVELAVSILGQLLGHGLIYSYVQIDKYKDSTQLDLISWLTAHGNNTTAIGRYSAWFLANICIGLEDLPNRFVVGFLRNMEKYLLVDDVAADMSLVSTTFSIFATTVKKLMQHPTYSICIIPQMAIRCLQYVAQTSNEPGTVLEWKIATVAVMQQNHGSEIFLDGGILESLFAAPFLDISSDADARMNWKLSYDMIWIIIVGERVAHFPSLMRLIRTLFASYRMLDGKQKNEILCMLYRLLYISKGPEDIAAIVGPYEGFPSIFAIFQGTIDPMTLECVVESLTLMIEGGYPKSEIDRQWEGLSAELISAYRLGHHSDDTYRHAMAIVHHQ